MAKKKKKNEGRKKGLLYVVWHGIITEWDFSFILSLCGNASRVYWHFTYILKEIVERKKSILHGEFYSFEFSYYYTWFVATSYFIYFIFEGEY